MHSAHSTDSRSLEQLVPSLPAGNWHLLLLGHLMLLLSACSTGFHGRSIWSSRTCIAARTDAKLLQLHMQELCLHPLIW